MGQQYTTGYIYNYIRSTMNTLFFSLYMCAGCDSWRERGFLFGNPPVSHSFLYQWKVAYTCWHLLAWLTLVFLRCPCKKPSACEDCTIGNMDSSSIGSAGVLLPNISTQPYKSKTVLKKIYRILNFHLWKRKQVQIIFYEFKAKVLVSQCV